MALCRWRWPVRPTPPAWSSTIPRPDRCTAISCVEPGQKYTQRDRLVTISSIISFDFFRLTPEINRLRTTSSLPMWAMGYGASHIAPYPKYCFSVHSNRCYPRRRTANTLIPASVIITATDSTTVPSEPVLARRPVADCGLLCDASPELGLSVSPVPGCCGLGLPPVASAIAVLSDAVQETTSAPVYSLLVRPVTAAFLAVVSVVRTSVSVAPSASNASALAMAPVSAVVSMEVRESSSVGSYVLLYPSFQSAPSTALFT